MRSCVENFSGDMTVCSPEAGGSRGEKNRRTAMWMEEEKRKQIQLNEYQRAAVLDESPTCVVNANVGSGKTTVLIEKILYLHLEKDVPLEDMVVLTFTNKAADEITERLLHREPGITPEQVQGFGTFHSVALRLLKNRLPVEAAGWTKEFTVMDPDEETDLALDIIAEQGLKVKYKNRLKKRLEQEYQQYLAGKNETRYKDDLFRLYPFLEEEKKRQNKMSFADLLRVSAQLLRDGRGGSWEADRRERDGWHPEWVIVDEVQDSDRLQLDFLEALCGAEGMEPGEEEESRKSAKLFAVGDPNQVIYSWRGTGENMFFLLKHRFGAKELTLPVNYRSNASILEAANRFLQFGNRIQGSRTEEGKILVKNHYDPFQEAEYLAERIRALHKEGRPYHEIAVFYRLQRQTEILAKVFEKRGIPYEISVKKTLKEIPVLNWLVKVLRFSVNPSDAQMAVQVLTDPQYGEKCTKKKAKEIVCSGRKPEAKGEADRRESAGEAGENKKATGPEKRFRKMRGFQGAFSCCGTGEGDSSCPSAEELFGYFDLREALHPVSESYAEDEQTVMEFLRRMCAACCGRETGKTEKHMEIQQEQKKGAEQKDWEGEDFVKRMREFLNSSALYGMKMDAGEKTPDEEEGMPGAGVNAGDGTVKLMTLHASKGLEFDTVFLTGVNQGLIPLRCQSFEQEEEERRLFFVGITRARNKLELSWYTSPGEPGVLGEPSRYLKMIPPHLLKREDVRSEEEKRKGLQQMRREVQEQIRRKRAAEKGTAERIRHRKYGEGILLSEDDMMIEVEFPGYGRKQFLKAFGEVERI